MAVPGCIRLTPTVVALYSVTSLVAVVSTAGVALEARFAAAAVATVAAAAGAVLLSRFVHNLPTLVVAAGLVGVLRGVVLVILLGRLGEAPADPLRVLNSVVSAVIWICAIAMVLAGRDRYRTQYAAAVRQLAGTRGAEALDVLPEVLRLKAAAGVAVSDAGREPTERDLRAAAEMLRLEIEEGIRPLSHRLWFSAQSGEPHVRIAPLVRDALLAFSVPVWPVVGVWTVSSLIGAPVIYGSAQGWVSAAACAIVLAASLLSASRIMKAWPRPWLGPVLLAACATVPVVLAQALSAALGFSREGPMAATYVLVPLAIGFLTLAAAAMHLANADRERVLEVVTARTTPFESMPYRELSGYLHNSLQSELAGLAMQLDRAEPGSPEAKAALERLAALASRSVADDFRSQRQSPLARIHGSAAAWRGIAEVTVTVDEASVRDSRLPIVVQAVEEMTSNAIRHGGARRVEVEIGPEGSELLVQVRSDGDVAAVSPGMGTGWLAAVSRAPAQVEASESGSVQRVRL